MDADTLKFRITARAIRSSATLEEATEVLEETLPMLNNDGCVMVGDYNLTVEQNETIKSFMANGKTIKAIKEFRGATGAGLWEAKGLVEEHYS